jgi:ribosomal protein S18 acetylase RimI-like enzyme
MHDRMKPMPSMHIRRLLPSDASAFHALRLVALRDCPSSFSSSYEEERDTPLSTIASRLAPGSGRNLFGAFDGEELVGIVGVGREEAPKLRHKASVRGMYVAASQRGKGAGRQLLEHALACCASMQGLRQVTLVVTAGNAAAIALYQAMGFGVYGTEPRALFVDGVYHDDVYMLRDAGPASGMPATS